MAGQAATRIAVLALIKDDQVLLLQRSSDAAWMPNVWHVPGGRVEAGESVQAAAIREIREELGVEVFVEDLEFRGIVAYDQTNDEDVDTFQFSTRRWKGEPRIMESHKHQAIMWAQVDNLPTNITAHSRVLLGNDGPVYVYVVDGEVREVISNRVDGKIGG